MASTSVVELLPANLQSTLHQVMDRVNASGGGIRVILLSTAEGVPLGRAYCAQDRHSHNDQYNNANANATLPLLNEDVLSNLESTWAPASKQFPLLHMGKEVKVVTAMYDQQRTIFHVYQAPIVVTILVGPTGGGSPPNLGAVRSTGIPLLKQVLEPLCTTLLNSLSPPPQSAVPGPEEHHQQQAWGGGGGGHDSGSNMMMMAGNEAASNYPPQQQGYY